MLKASFILNTLFAVVLLGILAVMLLFGYRYFEDSGYDSRSNVVEMPGNSATTSTNSATELDSNPASKVVFEVVKPVLEPTSQPASQVAVPPTSKALPKKSLVSLYPDDSDKYPAFTSLEKDNGIVVYSSGSEWSEVVSAKGVPIWIRGDLVKSIGSGYVEVVIPRVNARSMPNTQTSAVIGSLVQGEVLKVSRKKDGWVRAWSPIRFRAWVKTQDLQNN